MEKKRPESIRNQRRPKGILGPMTINYLHRRNPWVAAWWAAALPGMGHMMLGYYSKGIFLFLWEFLINTKASINTAILYSMTGQFTLAVEALDTRWLLLYIPVYIFGIWDSYRLAVEMNKYNFLAEWEGSVVQTARVTNLSINFLDKRNPWIAVVWSLFAPGIGHGYLNRLILGFFGVGWWIAVVYFSGILKVVHFSAVGAFDQARAAADPQWLLFIPSMYGFAIYDSYTSAVEMNKLFKKEQARFLKDNYQHKGFAITIPERG